MIELPTTPVPDNALLADIGDGEFRTYAFICHLAWRTHPQAEQPYTDLDYEQLAHFHPGNVPLTVSGVRARINRLVKAGLLRRERINNICWRTYPMVDTPAKHETMRVMLDHTQPLCADNCVRSSITPNQECKALSVTAHRTQPAETDVGVMGQSTHQPQAMNWVLSHVASSDDRQVMGDTSDNTQLDSNVVGAMPDHTQTAPGATWVLPPMTPSVDTKALDAISNNTQRLESGLGAMPDHSQTSTGAVAAMPDHTQAVELIELMTDQKQSDQGSDQIKALSDGQTNNTMSTQQSALVEALANLTPQAMSPAGIRECLAQPALTVAWLAYVLDPANGVQKPAAYLRKQVRRGAYPPPMLMVQSGNSAVERSDYAATLPANPHPTASPTSGQSAPMAVAQSRATRWPLDTG